LQRFSAEFLTTVATDVFAALQAPRAEAKIVAEHLVLANLMGLDSHGVVRIPLYTRWTREGPIQPGAPVSVAASNQAVTIVDCGYNFGQVGALRATELAVARAKEYGIACAVTRNCAHVGRVGHYTQLAAEAGMFALATANSPKSGHWVVPFCGLDGRIGANPVSWAAPGPGHPILADMALSTTAQGKVVIYRNRGKQLPEGWIIDASGNPTTDPGELFKDPHGGILPLGGNGGYKGFALLLLAEVLSSTLAGNSMTAAIPDGTNGFCIVVLDIAALTPVDEFRKLIGEMTGYVESAPSAPGAAPVMMPGELEFRTMAERQANGIPIEAATWGAIRETAESLHVAIAAAS
jgi:uncharacterized oxidoreductase